MQWRENKTKQKTQNPLSEGRRWRQVPRSSDLHKQHTVERVYTFLHTCAHKHITDMHPSHPNRHTSHTHTNGLKKRKWKRNKTLKVITLSSVMLKQDMDGTKKVLSELISFTEVKYHDFNMVVFSILLVSYFYIRLPPSPSFMFTL